MKLTQRSYDTYPGNWVSKWQGWDLNPGSLVLDHYVPGHLPFNIFMLPIKCDAQEGIYGVSYQRPARLSSWVGLCSQITMGDVTAPCWSCAVHNLHDCMWPSRLWTSSGSPWPLWPWSQEICWELLVGGEMLLEMHVEDFIWTKPRRFRVSLKPVSFHSPLLRCTLTLY